MAWRLLPPSATNLNRPGGATGWEQLDARPVSVAAHRLPRCPHAWRFPDLLAHNHALLRATTAAPALVRLGVRAWVRLTSACPRALGKRHAFAPERGRLVAVASTAGSGTGARAMGLGPALQSCSQAWRCSVAPNPQPASRLSRRLASLLKPAKAPFAAAGRPQQQVPPQR